MSSLKFEDNEPFLKTKLYEKKNNFFFNPSNFLHANIFNAWNITCTQDAHFQSFKTKNSVEWFPNVKLNMRLKI